MEPCVLCPRACGAMRDRGETGYCRMPDELIIARAAPHYWEEPCISGQRGTGAVFFTGCSLGCDYCQNYEVSHEALGSRVSVSRLREIFAELCELGVHSISLITPGHFLPQIAEALEPLPPVPVIYNTGGYERPELVEALKGKVSVYLPDLKYSDAGLAAEHSGAPDYFQVATRAIMEMHRAVGDYRMGDDGLLKSGVLIRHLILPGNVDNSFGVIDWIADNFRPGQVLFSLMSQYTPCGTAKDKPPFDRRITEEEHRRVYDYMIARGILDGFYQDPEAADEDYIPDFHIQPEGGF